MSLDKKITVTVCIPTYNQADFLKESIESILAQTYPVDEIIISDDASTDRTEAICLEYARKIPHLRYYRQPKNLGIGGNVEFVMLQATSTYVARVDSDDRILPRYLECMIGALEKYPNACCAHGDVLQIDEKGAPLARRTLYRRPGLIEARKALLRSLWGYRVAANVLVFRRAALENMVSLAGFHYGEDYFLFVDLARKGYGNVYVPETLAETRLWSDSKGLRVKRIEQLLAGLTRIFDEQIEPGFKEAGFPLEMVRRGRRAQAISHCVVMDSRQATPEEKERFRKLLFELGDSVRLRILMVMFKLHLGFVIHYYRHFVAASRKMVKDCLKALSCNPPD